MNSWTIEYANAARKELKVLPQRDAQRVRDAIGALATNPFPPGCKKLHGEDATYRMRVGDYRVLYEIHEKEVLILIVRVRHRKDAYNP